MKCAYCKETIERLDFISTCVECGAFQHFPCFNEYGRCVVYGCQSEQVVVQIPGLGNLLSSKYNAGECSIWYWVKGTPAIQSIRCG